MSGGLPNYCVVGKDLWCTISLLIYVSPKNSLFVLLFYFIAFSAIINFLFYLFDILLVLSDKDRGF